MRVSEGTGANRIDRIDDYLDQDHGYHTWLEEASSTVNSPVRVRRGDLEERIREIQAHVGAIFVRIRSGA